MDGNNWRANSGQAQVPGQVMGGEAPAAPGMDAADWRTQLPADSRLRIVNKIMQTLKRHLPLSGHEGMQELKKIAVRFEEETYTGATSQSDYLRKISLKMLTMETKSQPMAGTLQPNAPQDPAAPGMDAADWRTQLPADSRQRIVNKIMETLKRHLPLSGHEGMQELKKIALRFEEKTFTGATSQSDYLRKIALKNLTMEMETKSQPMAGTLQPNAPQDPGLQRKPRH